MTLHVAWFGAGRDKWRCVSPLIHYQHPPPAPSIIQGCSRGRLGCGVNNRLDHCAPDSWATVKASDVFIFINFDVIKGSGLIFISEIIGIHHGEGESRTRCPQASWMGRVALGEGGGRRARPSQLVERLRRRQREAVERQWSQAVFCLHSR